MNQISPVVALEDLYQQAVVMQEWENMELSHKEILLLDDIVDGSESSKWVLAVLLTSLLYKTLHPEQDIRNHQVQIVWGYSGRGFDTQYVTPFFKSKNFPAMASSGWLTRSLEQATPYDLQYSGKITPLTVKKAFLGILDRIQNWANSQRYITYLLSRLICLGSGNFPVRVRRAKRRNVKLDAVGGWWFVTPFVKGEDSERSEKSWRRYGFVIPSRAEGFPLVVLLCSIIMYSGLLEACFLKKYLIFWQKRERVIQWSCHLLLTFYFYDKFPRIRSCSSRWEYMTDKYNAWSIDCLRDFSR